MLPPSYALPTNVALVLAGALACFAGYRQFKLVLALAGFFIGALAASSMMAPSNGHSRRIVSRGDCEPL